MLDKELQVHDRLRHLLVLSILRSDLTLSSTILVRLRTEDPLDFFGSRKTPEECYKPFFKYETVADEPPK